MGRASSGKKVARAARAGGGVSRRRTGSWGFSAFITTVVVLGTFLVVFSRGQNNADASAPKVNKDHWHAALGFYVCNKFLPNLPQFENAEGLHTHGDGLIHLHPYLGSVAGRRATLGKFLQLAKVKVTETELKVENAHEKNGDKCSGKAAQVYVQVNHKLVNSVDNVRLQQGQLITIAFVPKGTKIPDPPSKAELQAPSDVSQAPPTSLPSPSTSLAPTPTSVPAPANSTPPPAKP